LGALERLLKSRKLPNRVDYNFSSGNQFQYRPEHVFRATEAKLLVCQVFFPNGTTPFDQELQQAIQPLINKDYSKLKARAVVETNVVPVFRKHGYLRAVARPPLGEIDPSCPRGVTIRAPIDPGMVYVWDKAVWSGNKVIPTPSLDQMLAMQSGEVANGQKIDLGLAAVVRAYGKQGYAALQLAPKPDFDDLNRRVTLNLAIAEGPQFRMGNLTVAGLSDNAAQMFKELWRIKTGDIYDATYLGEFLKRLVETGGVPADQVGRIKPEVKPDRQKLAVDVIIDFNVKP
jgi:outer membrane protein assembly factor BamA